MPAALVLLLIAVTAAAAIADLRSGSIPNSIPYLGAIAGVAVNFALAGADAGAMSLVGLFAALVPAALVMNGGDAKLLGAVGAICGWPALLGPTAFAFAVAGAWALVLGALHGRRLLARLPGLAIEAARGKLPDDDPAGPRVPVAAAVMIGAMLHRLTVELVPDFAF